MSEIAPEAQKALDKAMKVLEMAKRKKGNEAEAEAAAAKFQELLVKYNLSEAQVEQASGKSSGKREEKKVRGGFYNHQAELWGWAAELNFCLHWVVSGYEKVEKRRKSAWTGEMVTYTDYKLLWQHRLVGRTHNVAATIALAEYLEGAIERVVMETLHNDNRMRFSRYAVSMRKGMAARLCEKMSVRRDELLSEEKKARMKAEEDARRAARAGVSTSMDVSLADFSKTERDANLDHLYGEGWSAKRAAERAAAAADRARKEAEYAAWAAANPEEARAKEEEARKEREKRDARRRSSGRRSSSDDNIDYSAYYRGYDAAEEIGLDQQVATPSAGRLR